MDLMDNNKLFLLEEVVKRNFAAKYKGSFLGVFWTILRPLLIMIIMTIIFSTIFRNQIENYPVYILSGKCLYDFFNFTTSRSMVSLRSNQSILLKTAVPKYIFVIGTIISEFFNFLITMVILICVMIVTQSPFFIPLMFLTVIPIISLVIMISGISFILSIVSVYYVDIQHLWGVITLLCLYASAIFFPMDIIPEPFHQLLILNPIYWIVNQFRTIIIFGTVPETSYMINSLLLSVIILVIGIIVFKKYEKRITMKF